MTSVDFLVKLRDAAQLIADAAGEWLESMVPSDVKANEKTFDSLEWSEKTGTKSNYLQTTKEANDNNEAFQTLQQILRDHNGFWQSNTHKYWFHRENPDIIDRRKK